MILNPNNVDFWSFFALERFSLMDACMKALEILDGIARAALAVEFGKCFRIHFRALLDCFAFHEDCQRRQIFGGVNGVRIEPNTGV